MGTKKGKNPALPSFEDVRGILQQPNIVNLFEGEAGEHDLQLKFEEHEIYVNSFDEHGGCNNEIVIWIPTDKYKEFFSALAASIGKKVLLLDEGEQKLLMDACEGMILEGCDLDKYELLQSKLTALRADEPVTREGEEG